MELNDLFDTLIVLDHLRNFIIAFGLGTAVIAVSYVLLELR